VEMEIGKFLLEKISLKIIMMTSSEN